MMLMLEEARRLCSAMHQLPVQKPWGGPEASKRFASKAPDLELCPLQQGLRTAPIHQEEVPGPDWLRESLGLPLRRKGSLCYLVIETLNGATEHQRALQDVACLHSRKRVYGMNVNS